MMAMILSRAFNYETTHKEKTRGIHLQATTQARCPGTKKHDTHERILVSASRIARREGLRAASVPRVMSGAGLTTGGFYAHFPSKSAMDAEIVGTLQSPLRGLEGLEDAAGRDWLQRAVKRYLSVAHRDNVDGCGYPAVLSEVGSAPSEVRRAFAEALEKRVAAFEPHVPATAGVTAGSALSPRWR